MQPRHWTILLSLVAGVIIGAVLMSALTPPVSGTSVPSHGVSTATGCLKADDPQGWVGVVPEGEYRAVYLGNYTLVHDAASVRVQSSLTEQAPDQWVLALTTTPEETGKSVPASCQPRTLIDAAVAVPPTAETLRITVDGTQIAAVDTTANSPRFVELSG